MLLLYRVEFVIYETKIGNFPMKNDRSPDKLKRLLQDYVGVTADLMATFSPSEIDTLLESEPGISTLWQHIDYENEKIRRQLGSLRLKERLSQIPSYKEQEEITGPVLWEILYSSCELS